MGKKWYQSKLILVGIIEFIVGLTSAANVEDPSWESLKFAALAGASGALKVLLRLVTKEPITMKPKPPKTGALLIFLLVVSLVAVGCSAPTGRGASAGPDETSMLEEATTTPQGPRGGTNSAETSQTDFPNAVGVAWGASETTSNSLLAKYTPTQTNSGQGGLVTGFVQGLTAAQRQEAQSAVNDAVANDPVLISIADEMRYLMESEEYSVEWQGRIDELREQYAVARERLVGTLKDAGVVESLDLGNLNTLVVNGWANAYSGKDERPPTDEEAKQLARVLSNPVAAARGETVILGEGETVEEGADGE